MHAPLFGLTATHAYFSDGRCRTLSLFPTPECTRQMDRHRLLFRADAGGGTMFAHLDGPPVDAGTVFAFEARWSDPNWIHYTDLALGPDGFAPRTSVFFLTSRTEANDDPHPLHAAPTVTTDDQVPVRPPVFGVPFAPRLDVVDDAGTVVWSAPTLDATRDESHAESRDDSRAESTDGPTDGAARASGPVQVDLRGEPPGRYRLRSDGRVTETFFRTDRPASSLWGVVEVVWTDAFAQGRDAGDGPPVFTTHFGRRSTVWRYRIDRRYRDADFFERHDLVYVRRPRNGRGTGAPSAAPSGASPPDDPTHEVVSFSPVPAPDASEKDAPDADAPDADASINDAPSLPSSPPGASPPRASSPGAASSPAMRDDLVYESDRPLPLREDPTVNQTVAVGFRRPGSTTDWAVRLPYASAVTLHPDADRDVSDVFVTL